MSSGTKKPAALHVASLKASVRARRFAPLQLLSTKARSMPTSNLLKTKDAESHMIKVEARFYPAEITHGEDNAR